MNINTRQQIKIISFDDLNTQALHALIQTSLNTSCETISSLDIYDHAGHASSLILIDATYSNVSSPTAMAKLQEHHPNLRAALFNVQAYSPQELLVEWPIIKGLFYLGEPTATLLKGLRQLLNNSHWFPKRVSDKLLDTYRQPPSMNVRAALLSRRELHVVDELSKGKANKTIANTLFISEFTVKSHLYRIFKKIGAKNRAEVRRWALDNI